MDGQPLEFTRREFVRRGAAAAGGFLIATQRLPGESTGDPLPGQWPKPTAEEGKLLRIPLNDDQAVRLLEHKLDSAVLDDTRAIDDLKNKHLWPIPGPFWISRRAAKAVMAQFDANVAHEFHEHHGWDAHAGEPMTVGSVWRRFWQRASNHYHESDLANQAKCRGHQSSSPSPHPDPLLKEYLGKEIAQEIAQYRNIDFTTLNTNPKTPQEKEAFAMITRGRPQLDFPHFVRSIGVSEALLRVTREDLQAIGVDVDGELRKLPSGMASAHGTSRGAQALA